MKRTYLLLLVLTVCHLAGFTQKFYFQGSGGYAFGFLKDNVSSVSLSAKIQYDYEGTYLTNHPYYYPTANESYTYELRKNLNVGINSAIGLDFYIADKLILFVEAKGSFVSYLPKNGEYTKYIVNGDDVLNDLTVYDREVEYVKSYSSTDNLNDNAPRKRLRVSYSFSSLGLSAGIRFNFFQ